MRLVMLLKAFRILIFLKNIPRRLWRVVSKLYNSFSKHTSARSSMAQTNSTAVPPACQGTAGSLPELPFPMSCGISSYNNGNATIGQSVLASCCAGNPIAEFGNIDGVSNCWVIHPFLPIMLHLYDKYSLRTVY